MPDEKPLKLQDIIKKTFAEMRKKEVAFRKNAKKIMTRPHGLGTPV
jgi:hypothetical protein